MILDKPMIDYCRATTFDFKAYQMTVHELLPGNESGRRGNFQQYKGTRFDHFFHGQAGFGNKTGYIVESSGEHSSRHGLTMLKNGLKPTRIDLQVTVHMPSWWNAREAKDALKRGTWHGRRRDVGMIETDTATVTVGSRSSDRYIRIYEKHGNTVRFEVEYKYHRAVMLGAMIANSGGSCIAGVLAAELDKLPSIPICEELYRGLYDADPIDIVVPTADSDSYKRLMWLVSLLDTIKRMMLDSDYGSVVRDMFIDLLDQTDNERW